MYSEKAFGQFSTDNVFFLESVEDGLNNISVQKVPRFSTYLVKMGEV